MNWSSFSKNSMCTQKNALWKSNIPAEENQENSKIDNELTAVNAASEPLFPALPPARFIAYNHYGADFFKFICLTVQNENILRFFEHTRSKDSQLKSKINSTHHPQMFVIN